MSGTAPPVPARGSARRLPPTPTPHNSLASLDNPSAPPPLPPRVHVHSHSHSHLSSSANIDTVPPPIPASPEASGPPPLPPRDSAPLLVVEPDTPSPNPKDPKDPNTVEPSPALAPSSSSPGLPVRPASNLTLSAPPPRPRSATPSISDGVASNPSVSATSVLVHSSPSNPSLPSSPSFTASSPSSSPSLSHPALVSRASAADLRAEDKVSQLLGHEADAGGDGFLNESEFTQRYAYTIPVLDWTVHPAKRDKIAYELLTTETTYVRNMQITQQLYRAELLKAARADAIPFSEQRIDSLFGNMSFLLNVNTVLWQALKERFESWSAQQKLGDVLKTLAPYLKMYTAYASGYDAQALSLSEMQSTSTRFSALHSALSHHSLAQRIPLSGYLIQPVQRLPRYVLLLQDLLKNTPPEHVDHVDLTDALALMKEVAMHINEEIARQENKSKCLAIQARFPSDVSIVSPSRRFVLEGTLIKQCRKERKPREFFLFNDILVYAQTLPTGTLLYSATIDLKHADVAEVPSALASEFALQVLSQGKSFVVFMSSAQEKSKWLSALRASIDEWHKETANGSNSGGTGGGKGVGALFASVWASDDTADACTLCHMKFTFINRRHHCRQCGRLVCGACSDKKLVVKAVDPTRAVRVCTTCWDASRPQRSSSSLGPRSLSSAHLAQPQPAQDAQGQGQEQGQEEDSDSDESAATSTSTSNNS